MASAETDHYLSYEARLTSFQKSTKKRASAAGGRSKTLNWPHKKISPEHLAKAGFYFDPYPENPDNCVCFLCGKGIEGWEADDDPLLEHLQHAPECGWAIVTAIEMEVEEYAKHDPNSSRMVDARKATFGGRWPHENKKGWKCKTKQLVESGWKYTPTDDSDDMATCVYCQLALDGWEPGDKPYDEHYNRSPNCAFFTLVAQFGGPKKKTRGKGATSKSSRLSVQSVATAASEAPSVADVTAEPDDSILTVASTATQGGSKKPKRKKAAPKTKTKGKKAKAIEEEQQDEDAGTALEESEAPHAKSSRGQKRASGAIDDSVVFLSEAPAAKKQATAKARDNSKLDSSTITPEDVSILPVTKSSVRTSSHSRSASVHSVRKMSGRGTGSLSSLRHVPDDLLDDEEIERQLEADLERALSDDDEIAHDSESERSKAKSKGLKAKLVEGKSSSYAMFDTADAEVDEDALDDELKSLQKEMEVDEPEDIHVPKKGRKDGPRKVSKQAKSKKAKAPSPSPSPLPSPEPEESEPEPELVEIPLDHDEYEGSVVSIEDAAEVAEPEPEPESSPVPAKKGRGRPVKASNAAAKQAAGQSVKNAKKRASKRELASVDAAAEKAELPVETSSTPAKIISPAPSARQAAVSPSPSPQSSDAENEPPSSKPTASTRSNRIALAPVAVTPTRSSPSKRNVLGGLQSSTPWTAVDLDAILGTPRHGHDKENAVNRLMKQGKDLSSPEKGMTVEEWIYFNAGEAESRLKYECEAMVGQFEREGTRAMNVLEGLTAE